MRGQVLGVDTATADGQIAGEDGERYGFRPDDWSDRIGPSIGALVDFKAEGDRARRIYHVPGAVPAASPIAAGADRNRIVAALLAFVLGVLGFHRFYVGRTGTGVLMLALSCTVVGLFVTGPWALIDMIRYLLMTDRDFALRYARPGSR